MKKLLFYMRHYVKESILGPLFKLLEATLELIIPLVIAAIIDRGIHAADGSFAVRASLILVLFGIAGLLFSVTAQYFAAKAAVGATGKLRAALFRHIGTLSHRELDKLGTSNLITRISADMNQVQMGVNLSLRLLLRSPFVVFGAMIMAFTVDVESALTFTVVIPLLSIIVFGIMLISIPLYRKVRGRLDTVVGRVRENLSGVRTLRAYCQEDEQIDAFRQKNRELTLLQKFTGRLDALLSPLTYIVINGGIIFLIYLGAIKVNAGELSQGEVVALYNYMSLILVELVKMANLIINITRSVACAGRIEGVFEERSSLSSPEDEPLADPTAPSVQFKSVSLRYHGAGEDSLSDISFTAERGEVIGIIGGTGSGKSSLVDLIPRFYEASAGEVLVGGVNVKSYPLRSLREKIAVVPQRAVLFRGTVRENLLFGNEGATDEQLLRAVKIAQAENILGDEGLDRKIDQDGRNLSGGQRQRLTVARALVKGADILILDDAASALDYATEKAMRGAIFESLSDTTVFIVSQRASSVMGADKIIVLDDGKAESIGTHGELIETSELYREIYGTQFSMEDRK